MLKSLDKIAVADIKKEIVSHFSIGHSKKVGGQVNFTKTFENKEFKRKLVNYF